VVWSLNYPEYGETFYKEKLLNDLKTELAFAVSPPFKEEYPGGTPEGSGL